MLRKNHVSIPFTPWKQKKMSFVCFFEVNDSEGKFSLYIRILKWKFYNSRGFELKLWQLVKFWRIHFTTRQIFGEKMGFQRKSLT